MYISSLYTTTAGSYLCHNYSTKYRQQYEAYLNWQHNWSTCKIKISQIWLSLYNSMTCFTEFYSKLQVGCHSKCGSQQIVQQVVCIIVCVCVCVNHSLSPRTDCSALMIQIMLQLNMPQAGLTTAVGTITYIYRRWLLVLNFIGIIWWGVEVEWPTIS